ncbi:MAG: hypothetical protein ABIR32_05615 [Ilumatobacteraceae bacterium]
MKNRIGLAVGLVALVTLGSCGGSDSAKPAASIPVGALEIDAGPGLKWGQSQYTAQAGEVTVAMVNRDSQLHSLVIVDGNKKTQGPELEVGKGGDVDTGTFTLAPGEYQILCLVPGHNNMKATLTVG